VEVMAENSKISWTDHTFNPWVGCTKVSLACDHCYAEAWSKRSGLVEWGNHPRRRTSESYWRQPIKWNRNAEAAGVRRKVFCCSLADVFDNQVSPDWRADLWALIAETPWLDWLLLTKRPQNIAKGMLPGSYVEQLLGRDLPSWPWPNVWLGTTVENQAEAETRIPPLLSVPAKVHFLSCEPLLGSLHLPAQDTYWYPIDWVIAGGESGPRARPPMIGWVRSLRDQCGYAGIPFHFKQWGEYGPDDPSAGHTAMHRVGKMRAGALLDGREWREFPG
jgi:protein gp37